MATIQYRTPVSFTAETTPLRTQSWVRLRLAGQDEEETGLPGNVYELRLECESTNPEAVEIVAAFLAANVRRLYVSRSY